MIDSARVDVYTVPTDGPEADGTIGWDETTIVIVRLRQGSHEGIGYTYSHPAAASVIAKTLLPIVLRANPDEISLLWNRLLASVRNFGRQGIAANAISAVDVALWDLKAKTLGISVAQSLGAVRNSIPVYGSGGFTTYDRERLQAQISGWREHGIEMAKIKVGGKPDEDPTRALWAREALGPEGKLFVDANGAYDQRQALRLADLFTTAGVEWFEEPVPSDDLQGLCWLRSRVPSSMRIAAGEYGYDPLYFRDMLDAKATDVLQIDVTRCLGFSGFLKASVLCDANMHPISMHTAPMLNMHAACTTPRALHVEYFYDHSRIEKIFFDGFVEPKKGTLAPDFSRPGLGLRLKEQDVAKYRVKELI